ncbi:uncharacterized protein LOC111278989 isoform X2 [Durio zibethinus]|uniref:Uncharacterized protein LOC111278989 isoform X2 n=1 Tax=Durio zibethinus TaxID=66656 RepID=A0A6P5X169_DURZI|nr:uncharacterized protein LOC111278989 isoform X2 [Durio zibethinus]
MATKALVRTGASLMNRVMANPVFNPHPISSNRILNQGFQITPQLLSSLSKQQPSLRLPQTDADFLSNVSSLGFLYPNGLPSLRFLLPDGTLSLSLCLIALKPSRKQRFIKGANAIISQKNISA